MKPPGDLLGVTIVRMLLRENAGCDVPASRPGQSAGNPIGRFSGHSKQSAAAVLSNETPDRPGARYHARETVQVFWKNSVGRGNAPPIPLVAAGSG